MTDPVQIWPEELAARYRAKGYWQGETFGQLLDRLERGFGPRVAVVDREQRWSYAELARLPAYAHQPGLISQLLQVLAWAGWLHVLLPAGTGPVAAALAPLNTYLRTAPVGQPPTALQALEAIGSAVPA